MPKKKPLRAARLAHALRKVVETIEATGGVTKRGEYDYEPVADPEWIDLGNAYIAACAALRRQPKFVEEVPS